MRGLARREFQLVTRQVNVQRQLKVIRGILSASRPCTSEPGLPIRVGTHAWGHAGERCTCRAFGGPGWKANNKSSLVFSSDTTHRCRASTKEPSGTGTATWTRAPRTRRLIIFSKLSTLWLPRFNHIDLSTHPRLVLQDLLPGGRDQPPALYLCFLGPWEGRAVGVQPSPGAPDLRASLCKKNPRRETAGVQQHLQKIRVYCRLCGGAEPAATRSQISALLIYISFPHHHLPVAARNVRDTSQALSSN